MSLMGIDVGTTGCKAVVFDDRGAQLSSAYREYDIDSPEPRYAELDVHEVWSLIRECIADAAGQIGAADPIEALSVTSMGEAVVPVDADGTPLAPSILNVDVRGESYIERLRDGIAEVDFYELNGNVLANQYTLPKLMWIRDHQPRIYERTNQFMLWSTFVSYKLGAESCVDFSLANRTLLFDIGAEDWSTTMLKISGIERAKLPTPVATGTVIGTVSSRASAELGLPPTVSIVAGAHDQCANSIGAGAVLSGQAMYGMGTFPTITPVYDRRPNTEKMIELGLNTEHHAVQGLWVSFIYHMGGASIKWYRDQVIGDRNASYDELFAEVPDEPAPVLMLPHFAPMGPPDYISNSTGVIVGLTTETTRGAILRGIIESNALALKRVTRHLPEIGVELKELRVIGGGSRSQKALEINASMLGLPVVRPVVTEGGAFGAAILAGTGIGRYSSAAEAAGELVQLDHRVEPDPVLAAHYDEVYEMYDELRALVVPFTQKWTRRSTN